MTTALWLLLIGVWVTCATQAVLSALLVRKFARMFGKSEREKFDRYRPAVAVVVPFKGVDDDLAGNLRGLFSQDYRDYHLVLVVESEDDAAYPILCDAVAAHPDRRAEVLVAGLAPPDEGQKVHNLLAAAALLRERQAGDPVEVWAFADSDAVPGPGWLGSLVGPLVKPANAATSGYRWFVPTDDSFWSRVASVINSSVACFAARQRFILAWGGSMAVRVQTAEEGGLVDRWRGALSDDYAVTRMAWDLGSRVYFVPHCLVPAPASFTARSLFEFGRRQYLITRVHAPRMYAAAVVMTTHYVVAQLVTAVSVPLLYLRDPSDPIWLAPGGALLASGVADVARAAYRRRVVRIAFGEEVRDRLRGALRLDLHYVPVWMGIHWLIVLSAAVGRTITWRGNRYVMRGPQAIEKLSPRG